MTMLPAHYEDDLGRQDYTEAGQAEADLTSACMALRAVLRRPDLTRAQFRGLSAALSDATEAALHLRRHVDTDAVAKSREHQR